MKKLTVLGNYRNDARGLVYTKGETFEADDDLIKFLMADSPGCFAVAAKAVEAPPADKMLRTPDKAK